MAAKLNTTKRISLKNGSAATGVTVPRPGSLRGGGQTAGNLGGGSKGGGMTPSTGGGFGNTRGLQKGRGC